MAGTRLILVGLTILAAAYCVQGKNMNILFLVSDDMRPEIGAWQGADFPSPVHPPMHTPNLDKLASESLLLKHAYVQQAVCSPSRTSLLTSRRPDTTHVYDLVHYFRHVGGNFTTLPEFFKDKGYTSVGMGKIFHPGVASGHDDPISWNMPYFHAGNLGHWAEASRNSWTAADDKMTEYYPLEDMQIAKHAIETLHKVAAKAKTGEKPFFVGVGFHKPHLPFLFPARFMEYYPEDSIHLPPNPYAPVDMPEVAWFPFGGLRNHKDIHNLSNGTINTTLPDATVKKLRRAYYSALTYTDSLVGGVIKTLDELGLRDNTIISFWGDHGWQLGEHGEWCKQTNFELATHAPMMVHIPGLTDKGIEVEQLTEYVDLFPTLVEAAGFPALPTCPEDSVHTDLCTEGMSLLPLIDNPKAPWKKAAFSQYPREKDIMGYTMRTEQYRYTEWPKFDHVHYKPMWDDKAPAELYDHMKDPEENVNVAHHEDYAKVRSELSKQLRDGWRAAKS